MDQQTRTSTGALDAEGLAAELLAAVEAWPDAWDGRERDALALVRFVLHEIADGDR